VYAVGESASGLFPTVPARTMPIMYAGRTASFQPTQPVRPWQREKEGEVLGFEFETRPPYFLKNRGVKKAALQRQRRKTAYENQRLDVNGERSVRAQSTVPRSLMKQAARIAFPLLRHV